MHAHKNHAYTYMQTHMHTHRQKHIQAHTHIQRHMYTHMLLLLLSRFSRVRHCNPIDGQPTRLRHPWDSPGKNTGVGCHFLLQCMKVKSESEVAQSCPTFSDPMDCSLPGSSVHGFSRQEHAHIHLDKYIRTYKHTCAYIQTHMHTHRQTHAHTHMCTHMHTCTQVHTQSCHRGELGVCVLL